MSRTNENMNPLTKVDYTKITQEQIEADVRSLLEVHPLYKTEWQDFLDSNAGQMLVQTFSYIANKMILRADFIANELYLPTSQDPKSIVNGLKLIGYNLKPPTASSVPVVITSENGSPITIDLDPGYQIEGTGLDGNQIYFELCAEENDYDTVLKMENEISKIFTVFAGTKNTEYFSVSTKENFEFSIRAYPIIDGSLRVYIDGDPTPLEEITSLILFGKDSQGRPRYTVSYDENFIATIRFGRENYGGAFETIIDGLEDTYVSLRVVYRTGGGRNSNITRGSINISIGLLNDVAITILNKDAAVGGGDGETIEEAKVFAPLTTKTVNKTVTPEDYITLLRQQNYVKIINVSIDSPYEDPSKVPYLFNYIYLSPQRNWSNFILETTGDDISREIPDFIAGETIDNYVQRFQIRLNNFLNITGASSENNELMRDDSLNYIETGVSNELGLFYPDPDENNTEYFGEAKVLYYKFLQDKKITGIENIFRIANFKPFKIEGNLYYKKGFNSSVVKTKVLDALRSKYSLENAIFKNSIKLSEIYGTVHSISEVAYFQITYPTTDLSTTGLNEMLFLLPTDTVALIPEEARSEFDLNITMLKS